MKKLLFYAAAAVAILAATAHALNTKYLEDYGASRTYSARTSIVSSHTVTGILVGWSVMTQGGSADFEVKHSTNYQWLDANYPPGDPNVNDSSTIYVLAGQEVHASERGFVVNPTILITRIDQPGTTAYVLIQYLAPRYPGEF